MKLLIINANKNIALLFGAVSNTSINMPAAIRAVRTWNRKHNKWFLHIYFILYVCTSKIK